MYVITGATGNTGSRIARELLREGRPVRVIARGAGRLGDLVELGAQPAGGDLADAAFLAEAFRGATAVYAMIPPNYAAVDFRAHQNTIASALARAVAAAGVTHVVTLSSVGAHLTQGAGVVQGLHDLEQTFNALPGVHVLHLRPTYFLENFLGQAGTVKALGVMGSPLRPDVRFPVVHTRDIAAVAARRLAELSFTGKGVEYILGAEEIDFRDAARVLGGAIGRPELAYVEFPFADARRAMVGEWGFSPSAADAFLEFQQALNDGRITEEARRTPENTTATRLEHFAPEFAAAYSGS